MRDTYAEVSLVAACAARGLTLPPPEVYDTIPSTNTALVARARVAPPPEHTVLLARKQTAGKGSRGRDFWSPNGGLYLSVWLSASHEAQRITCAAAVAVRRAILSVFGIPTDIKWVNDLYLHGRKVCGILAEAVTTANALSGVVLGIGVNLALPDGGFPTALAEIAGALTDTTPDKETFFAFAAAILVELFACLADHTHAWMQDYRTYNLVCGCRVLYHRPDGATSAIVRGITDEGALHLVLPDGVSVYAASGEVTLLTRTT